MNSLANRVAYWLAQIEPELQWQAMRAQGAGGQNVNKVASAIHLRWDISASQLNDTIKTRLLALKDNRITKQGILIIKAQQFRTQEANRQAALNRLKQLIESVASAPKSRVATQPTLGSKKRRLVEKTIRSQIKSLRQKPQDYA